MSFKRTLVFGAGGMLGRDVVRHFRSLGQVLATDRNLSHEEILKCDASIIGQVKKLFSEYRPTVVLNLAAQTSLEFCETNIHEAWRDNTLACEIILRECRKLEIPYVFIGTAGIFDGTQQIYDDFASPNPISVYGKTKFAAEKIVLGYEQGFVIRAGWMMGGGIRDHKFVSTLVKKIINGEKDLFVVDDKYGTPTYTRDFASGISEILKVGLPGVYNQVCSGTTNRLEVAKAIVHFLDVSTKVHAVPSDFFKETFFAKRPESEQLENLKLALLGINTMRHWKVSLEEYLPQLVKELSG